MRVNGVPHRTVWAHPGDPGVVRMIDQTRLPHAFEVLDLRSADEVAAAIREMRVRGAPAIGAAAAYGAALAVAEAARSAEPGATLDALAARLRDARPTAADLAHGVDAVLAAAAREGDAGARAAAARAAAAAYADASADACAAIGRHGLGFLAVLAERKGGGTLNVLTHCNAGWLACVDHGTALAPIYAAHDAGLPVHVWVDETRPRNQGAQLTAWELGEHGVPHTVIADNAGGLLMRWGLVDAVIVGADRVAANGDVANKIGTYLKATAARDTSVPFLVAAPASTIDWSIPDGDKIPIEERPGDEVRYAYGLGDDGRPARVLLTPPNVRAANPAFDVTPARLVTGFVTERGVAPASREGLLRLYPERGGEERSA